jgi:hypothetical protein
MIRGQNSVVVKKQATLVKSLRETAANSVRIIENTK